MHALLMDFDLLPRESFRDWLAERTRQRFALAEWKAGVSCGAGGAGGRPARRVTCDPPPALYLDR